MSIATAFSLRLPPALDSRLREAADAGGRSLNAEILARLEGTFGSDPRVGALLDALELPHAVRLRHATTTATLKHVLQIVELLAVDRLVLAARTDALNDVVLVLLMQTASHSIVLDKSMLNMARRPRMLEVAELFRGLDAVGLLDLAEYHPKVLAAEAMPADVHEAAGVLLNGIKPLEELGQFLKLLAPHGLYDIKDFRGAGLSAARGKRRKAR